MSKLESGSPVRKLIQSKEDRLKLWTKCNSGHEAGIGYIWGIKLWDLLMGWIGV